MTHFLLNILEKQNKTSSHDTLFFSFSNTKENKKRPKKTTTMAQRRIESSNEASQTVILYV